MKMTVAKKLLALTLSCSMMFSLAACGDGAKSTSSQQTGDGTAVSGDNATAPSGGAEFIIGNPQPLTGVNALVGDSAVKATNLAAKLINEKGGINGVPVRIVTYDDQGSPEEAVKLASKLIEVDKVDAVIGSLSSSCVLASGGYFNDAKIPVLGTGNSPTWMKKGWDYVFRACMNIELSMPFIVDKMLELDMKTVAVFFGQDDAAKTSAETFMNIAKEKGLQIIVQESYVDGDTDYSGQVAKIVNAKPDTVFCSTNGPTQAIFAKQLRQAGYNGLAFNREAFPVDSLEVAGDAANYWAFGYPYISYSDINDCQDPFLKEFLQLYLDEYGELPFHDCAYRSWDSMMVLAEAARIAGSNDSTAIKDAISQVKDFQGLGGMLDFTDGTGEGLHTLNTYIVVNGKFEDFDKWVADGKYKEFKASLN